MKMFDLVQEHPRSGGGHTKGIEVDVAGWKKGWGRQKADYEDGLSNTAPRAPELRRGLTP